MLQNRPYGTPPTTPPEPLRERRRLQDGLRQLADAVEDLEAPDLAEVLVHLSAPAKVLFAASRLLLEGAQADTR